MDEDKATRIEDLLVNFGVLHLEPGDILVLMSPHRLSQSQKMNMSQTIRARLPDTQVLVLEEGMTLGKLNAEGDRGSKSR